MISDERTNTLVIRDIEKNVKDANDLVRRLDTRTAQILIESNLIETTPTFARALGFNLDFTARIHNNPDRTVEFSSDAPAGSPFSNALGLTFSVIQNRVGVFRNINTILNAAESEGNIKIISRPSVVTLNNVESTIESLRIVRVQITTDSQVTQTGGQGVAVSGAAAVQDIKIGITLKVTPQVSSDGFVLMKIFVKSSSQGSRSLGAAVPDELSREANSNVLVRDGETIVIGGIMKDTRVDNESGIPYLKDIPVIGWLFKSISFQNDFEELMVFITPRIISAGASNLPTAEQLWRDNLRKTVGG